MTGSLTSPIKTQVRAPLDRPYRWKGWSRQRNPGNVAPMASQARNQNRDIVRTRADAPVARRRVNPVLVLQRKIGNRATGQIPARAPATKDHGTVKIGKLPAIK